MSFSQRFSWVDNLGKGRLSSSHPRIENYLGASLVTGCSTSLPE